MFLIRPLVKRKGKRYLWPIGLGNQSPSGGADYADHLMHVEVKYVPTVECNVGYGDSITSKMMCAADPGSDSCQGDSGGPLYDSANDVIVSKVNEFFSDFCLR